MGLQKEFLRIKKPIGTYLTLKYLKRGWPHIPWGNVPLFF